MDVLVGAQAEPVVTQPAGPVIRLPAPAAQSPRRPADARATPATAPAAGRPDERSRSGRGGPRR